MSKPQMEIQLTYPKGTTSEQLIEALELWIQGIRSGKESLGRGNNLDVVELERMYKL